MHFAFARCHKSIYRSSVELIVAPVFTSDIIILISTNNVTAKLKLYFSVVDMVYKECKD